MVLPNISGPRLNDTAKDLMMTAIGMSAAWFAGRKVEFFRLPAPMLGFSALATTVGTSLGREVAIRYDSRKGNSFDYSKVAGRNLMNKDLTSLAILTTIAALTVTGAAVATQNYLPAWAAQFTVQQVATSSALAIASSVGLRKLGLANESESEMRPDSEEAGAEGSKLLMGEAWNHVALQNMDVSQMFGVLSALRSKLITFDQQKKK